MTSSPHIDIALAHEVLDAPQRRTPRAQAKVAHAGRRQAVCGCDLYAIADNGTTLCAVAQGAATTK